MWVERGDEEAEDKNNEMKMDKAPAKRKIIFVGSFAPAAGDGTIGGQMFACRSLLESPLSSEVDWRLIDTTMKSQPPPGAAVRLYDAFRRLTQFVRYLIFGRVDGALIFSSYNAASLSEKGLMCILGKLFGKRVVLSLRSEVKPQGDDRWLRWFKRRVILSCDTVICQSKAAAQAVAEVLGCSGANTVVIPNWIDCTKYEPAEADEASLDAPDRQIAFIFMGWLEVFKGVGELVDATRLLVEKGLPVRVVICGGGFQREPLESRCRQLNLEKFIEFRGWTTGQAKIDALQEADIFVLPSYSEGLPNSLLEAMSTGLAVITTPVGGIPSVIEPGVNGLLIKPRDSVALAQAMEELAADLKTVKRMGKINRAKILQDHDINRVWPQVAAALGLQAIATSRQSVIAAARPSAPKRNYRSAMDD